MNSYICFVNDLVSEFKNQKKNKLTLPNLLSTNQHKNNYKVFEGNKPTNSILVKEINPYNLGSLLAVYEHKIFVQGIIWNIFSFDQWDVELGKELASDKLVAIKKHKQSKSFDQSTNGLLAKTVEWQ